VRQARQSPISFKSSVLPVTRLYHRLSAAFNAHEFFIDVKLKRIRSSLLGHRLANNFVRSMRNSFRTFQLALAIFFVLSTAPYGSMRSAGNPQRPENDELFQLLNQIQRLQKEKQEKNAIPLVERALSLAEKTVPSNDPRYVSVLIAGGEVYWHTRNNQKAEQLLQRAVRIAEGTFEPSHPLVFTSLVDLGLFYREQEDGASSQPLFKKLVALMEKLHGPEHRDVAVYVKLLAESYYQQGDYVHARPLYERAVAMLEKLGDTQDRFYFATLNDLSTACEATGDYVRAGTLLRQVINLKLKLLGPEDPSVANSLRNLGSLTRTFTHNFEQAATFYQRALVIYEKALGSESPEVANVLNQLGLLYSDTGDFDRAEPYFKRALAIREKKLGKENRYTSEPLLNLAWMEYARGNYAQAEPAYLRAIQINERAVGANHPEVQTLLAHLAMLYEAKGDIAKAVAAQKRSGDIAEYNLNLTLAQGTEEQKLLYMNTLRGETYGTISLHLRSAPNDLDAAKLALTTILRRKGRMLDVLSDSLGALRRRLAPADVVLLDQLSSARSKLATAMLNANDKLAVEELQTAIAQLEAEISRLEAEVSARSADFGVISKPVTVEHVQESIPPGASLLEFVWYQPFNVKGGNIRAWSAPRYAVYLVQRDGPLAWVDLGEASPIDADIDRFRTALRDPKRADIKTIARSLDERIMRPARKLTRLGRQLFLAPDAALNLIPFAALVDERDKYLIENYSISYLTSGRDLLRLKPSPVISGAPIVLANPLYDLTTRSTTQADGNRRSLDFTALTYPPLPGTMEEAAAIKTQLPDAQLLSREQATEAAVKRVQSPRILHIATHGFFLPDQPTVDVARDTRQLVKETPMPSNSIRLENPLLRSGLVLAGVKQRSSGESEDGVLTALEAAGLNLSGTKLVVLSACETGLGDVSNGEGVYGLRRALVLAGSETQVMSLWQVSDTATRDLMVGYYKRLKVGEGRAEAFRQVQLEMLHTNVYSHPYFWASFIQSGAWTSLDGR
jgi:CHAT domain-containing protein